MRLWTIHPQYLDRQGLLAVWREGLLAKYVLEHWVVDSSQPIGYRNHPQLIRFKATDFPVVAISLYLKEILAESQRRGYHFNEHKITIQETTIAIPVTTGQIEYEKKHLITKLQRRDSQAAERLQETKKLRLHPLFVIIPGDIETWEKRT